MEEIDDKAEGQLHFDMGIERGETLRESEAHFKRILNSLQTGIVIIDPETRRIVDLNPAALDMIGSLREQAVGRICHNFICPSEEGQCPVKDLGKQLADTECSLLKTDGSTLPILKTVVPVTLRGKEHLLESFIDITGLKDTERTLAEERTRFKTIFDSSPVGISVGISGGMSMMANKAFQQMLGYTEEEIRTLSFTEFTHPADIDENLILFREMVEGKRDTYKIQKRFVRKDGLVVWGDVSVIAVRDDDGKYLYNVVIAEDVTGRKRTEAELNRYRNKLSELVEERTGELITTNEELEKEIADRRRAEEALKKSERFLNTVFFSIRDPFIIMDRELRIIRANEAYAEIKGIRVEELLGRKCHKVLLGKDAVCDDCVVMKTFRSGDPCAKEKRVVTSRGAETWVAICTYPVFDENRNVAYVIEYTRDITERNKADKEREHLIERLEQLSRTDSLTGMLNRRALIEKLEEEFKRVRRYGSELSLMLCDVDFLKDINDTYGHAMGDVVLKAVSRAIADLARDTDISGRYGGDEFMIILPETPLQGAVEIAERIRTKARELQFKDNTSAKISLSLGVAGFMPGMQDIDSLIMCADTALYMSKQSGRNRVRTFKGREASS